MTHDQRGLIAADAGLSHDTNVRIRARRAAGLLIASLTVLAACGESNGDSSDVQPPVERVAGAGFSATGGTNRTASDQPGAELPGSHAAAGGATSASAASGMAGAPVTASPGVGGGTSPAGGAGGYAGSGYPSAAGGDGGGVVLPVQCGVVPLPSTTLATWQEDGTPRTLDEAFWHVAQGMPGNWHGVVTTPWIPPYEVSISFNPDGGYSARCDYASNMCCVALYYGTDDDTPLKRYDLDWVTKEGTVGGTIEIIFGDASHGYYESGYQGELKNVELDATGNRMRFDFWDGGEYGPLAFDLARL